jgi:hypothetical protein
VIERAGQRSLDIANRGGGVAAEHPAREAVRDRNFDTAFAERKMCSHVGLRRAAWLSIGRVFVAILICLGA